MEVRGAEDLGEESVGGLLGQLLAVEALGLYTRDIGELKGWDELHGEHARRGGLPEDRRHLEGVYGYMKGG